ncbi:MAG: M48 family metalloprotease [Candidatus Dadabacteria bacterium]|nr:M48 family metalloprotease [Candidatus Dadabacteria bacterium]NIS09109.1 M48 family metalloprotease [Candidatus Dadabacteria bacterium]NIV41542.1 M48 family metalloprotease [Candidatus Dadabacteria bacterium]NIX15686.1 M48 family metalloprotease [Candidatus Dadabacteria bacterium]NIY22417.1 M48 family metalloprotease [Candidatus Dadabacteria bacterium]
MRFLALFFCAFIIAGCSAKKVLKAPERSMNRISAALENSKGITPDQEYYIGRAVAAKIVSTYSILEDEDLTTYINLVGNTVAENSDNPDIPAGYHFGILDTKDINAFACPGGVVFVTKGLLDTLESEDELAAVLAHEIAHINNRDGILSIEDVRKSGVLSAILLEPFKFAASLTPLHLAGFSGEFLSSVDSVVNTVSNEGYNKEQELAADRDALNFLQRAAYNPAALISYQKKVLKHHNAVGSGDLGTHPGLTERINTLESITPAVEQDATKVELRKQRFNEAVNG